MDWTRFAYVIVVLTVTLNLHTAEAKRCRKGQNEEAKCRKKKDKGSRLTDQEDKKPAAPQWRKRSPRHANEAVREGGELTLNCAMRGSPKPVLSWTRDGRSLSSDKKSKKYRMRRTKLTIKRLEMSDSGHYTCTGKNELGSLNFTYSVSVLENMPLKDIEVVTLPEDQVAHPGDTVIFRCRSEDWPKPQVYWIRKTDASNIIEIVSPIGNHSEVLVLHNVSKADSGVYTCSIFNDMVNKEHSARLDVIDEHEKLPFEPACSLHIRRDHIVDHKTGCRTSDPVDIYYCMGSCGRSYYVPLVMTSDTQDGSFHNQTCSCCAGEVDALSIVEMDCPLGTKKRAFYQKLRECRCQSCATEPDRRRPIPDLDWL